MNMFTRRGGPLGTEAQWLSAWCQKNVRAPTKVGGAEALVESIEADAERENILLKRGLKELGYSKLEDYILDQLDERADEDEADDRPAPNSV